MLPTCRTPPHSDPTRPSHQRPRLVAGLTSACVSQTYAPSKLSTTSKSPKSSESSASSDSIIRNNGRRALSLNPLQGQAKERRLAARHQAEN